MRATMYKLVHWSMAIALTMWCASASLADEDFFEAKIRPLLIQHCLECHSGVAAEGGLRLDSAEGLRAGGISGPAITAGEPAHSRMLEVLPADAELHMPPDEQLSEESIALLRQWIETGANWPARLAILDPKSEALRHWAFQPLQRPVIPDAAPPSLAGELTRSPAVAEEFSSERIDFWIERSQQARGLESPGTAEARVLMQRLYFDLIGLPPTWDDWLRFSSEPWDIAWPKLVDELLARPEFGERWARHWLDVVRYADTKGYVFEEDRYYKTAYLYRDWIIRAFNEDIPYDEFLRRQIAVDTDPSVTDRREWAALGFWTLGRRFLNNPYDIWDDRVDVLTRGTLGLTVACARCHDHKYDPISAADYYSLTGIVAASRETQVPLSDPSPSYLAELERRQNLLAEYEKGEAKQGRINELRRQISEWENSDQAPLQLLVLQEPEHPPEQPFVLLRGNPNRPGPPVPRQFINWLAPSIPQPFESGSGRRELAQAITAPDNPLTARVWVNRVWMHLWGQGLVRTPSDFGLRSDHPEHPELLDELAAGLIADGWSTKRLLRRLVMSRVYRHSSVVTLEALQQDPENRGLSRFPRRRLDWESMRDRLLVAAGRLDATQFGPSQDIQQLPYSTRRTLYAFIDRQNLPGLFRTFDFASPDSHSPQRFTTTVPQQALYLMNDPFVIEMAAATYQRAQQALADERESPDRAVVPVGLESPPNPAIDEQARAKQQVQWLYREIFLREPTAAEIDLAVSFVFAPTAANPDDAPNSPPRWTQYVQALLMSNEFQFVD